MAQPRFTSFLVKVASRCNLDCDYCYMYHHADQSWQSMPTLMSAQTRQAFSARLAEYTAQRGIDRCLVIFHGGEPLLFGASALTEFAQELRHAVGPSVSIDIGLQTNGLLLTKEAIEELARESISISLSLDGPKEANDLHRTTRRGRSSFQKTMQAFKLLKEHPTVFSGIIAVIDPQVPPEVLFEFFAEHAPPKLDFLLPDANHLRPPPGRDKKNNIYTEWLIRAFDLWVDKYPEIPLRTFESLLDSVAGLPSGTDAFGFGDISLITIETDGSYHDLDVLKVAHDGATKLHGSVETHPISHLEASKEILEHQRLLTKEGLCSECQRCTVVEICGGGSLPHRYSTGTFNHPTVYCEEMFALISHVRSKLQKLLVESEAPLNATTVDIELSNYELAESGSQVIDALWRDARRAHSLDLTAALDALLMKSPAAAPMVHALKNLPEATFANIASHPATVAWQKAMLSTIAGRTLYTVDGDVLQPDESYLRELLRLSADDFDSLDVASETAWLRLPFGKAIAFEPPAVADRARPLVEQAMKIVDEWRPDLGNEMRKTSRVVQFVRDPAASPDKIVSFSDNTTPGALFVSVLQGKQLIDPYDLADSLVHEHRHQKLYLLERALPLVEPNSLKVASPWREDLRPPSGLLHAVFVFVELRRFWSHVRTRGPEHLKGRANNQIKTTDQNLTNAFRTLRTCPLTAAGKELTDCLERTFKRELHTT